MPAQSNTGTYRLTLLASFAVHVLGAAAFWVGVTRSTSRSHCEADPSRGVRVEALDGPIAAVDGVAVDETSVDWTGVAPRRPAGDTVAHIDNGPPGRGGDPSARVQALNLADADDRARWSPDLLNRLDRDQLQRLHASRSRASWDDRRSTTHPAELAFVVVGPGSVHEPRPWSPAAPSRGANDLARASERGVTPEGSTVARSADADGELRQAGDRISSPNDSPGAGLRHSPAGDDHRTAAPAGETRPSVVRARVAVPASERAAARDDVDSDQEVATVLRTLVHASAVGGVPGDQQGGSAGGGAGAVGGATGATSHARALGDGDAVDFDTEDASLVSYFRQIHKRIDPLWAHAFPRSALIDLKQGTVILEFSIYGDGHAVVAWPPLRSSGIEEFDRNCAEAIRRAAPFPPIPRELGADVLRIRAPFVASNPIVK